MDAVFDFLTKLFDKLLLFLSLYTNVKQKTEIQSLEEKIKIRDETRGIQTSNHRLSDDDLDSRL